MRDLVLIPMAVVCLMACSPSNEKKSADMYEASEMSALMRDMVTFSKDAQKKLSNGESIDEIPKQLWNLKNVKGTRDEDQESAFQSMTDPYLNALKGIQRGDSQAYYYSKSIDACKTCHGVYCGGPMAIINKLDLK